MRLPGALFVALFVFVSGVSPQDPFSAKITADKNVAKSAASDKANAEATEALRIREANSITVPADLSAKMEYRRWGVAHVGTDFNLIDPTAVPPGYKPRVVIHGKLSKIYFYAPNDAKGLSIDADGRDLSRLRRMKSYFPSVSTSTPSSIVVTAEDGTTRELKLTQWGRTSPLTMPDGKIVSGHKPWNGSDECLYIEAVLKKLANNSIASAISSDQPARQSGKTLEGEANERRNRFLPGERAASTSASQQHATSSISERELPSKFTVPDANALADAAKVIKEVYGDEWAAAKTTAQKQALAEKLLQKAKETEKDDAARFVLLRSSRDIATQSMNGPTAFQAIDEMNRLFQIDALEMKSKVLTKGATIATSPEQHQGVANKAIELSDEAVANDNFTIAKQMSQLALGEARKGSDAALINRASQRITDIEELSQSYEAVKKAIVTLEASPADPDANLTVGKYKCFIKGDWNAGLSMMVLGNDASLKALAKQELDGVASSSDQARLGDCWWSLAEKEGGGAKKQIQQRAAYWYQQALPGLAGLAKDKVEKRLRELDVTTTVANGDAQSAKPKVAAKLKEQIVGTYVISAIQKRAQQRKTLVWELHSDGSASEKDSPIGSWSMDDERVRVQFSDKASGQAILRSRGKGELVGEQTYQNGDVWNCVASKVFVVAKGEHRNPSRHQQILLWSNGHIDSPDSSRTWERSGSHLLLHWGPVVTDDCTLSADGTTYKGRNQKSKRIIVTGTLSWSQ